MEIEEIIKHLNELNFTAIDFETANEQRNSVCSIGLVLVRNGIIEQKKNILIKPIELRFSEFNKKIHGINEREVENAPEFNEVWEEIQSLVNCQIVLAHNADFDIDVLKQTLAGYKIKAPNFKYICTQKLSQETFKDLQNYRLIDVANYLGINFTHHNSLSDAIVTAEIGLRAIPKYEKKYFSYAFEELTYRIHKKGSAVKTDSFSVFEKKSINSDLLKPNLNNKDTSNLFYNKRVVFTGDLQSISRQDAAIKIQNLGADINTSISKKTEIVIVGNGAGPSKMKKIEELQSQGISIKIIYEAEFISLIAND